MENNAEAVRIELTGRIDSNNAQTTEKEIADRLLGKQNVPVILDAAGLEYISSAGLRILLRVKRTNPELTLTNASSEVYDILEMTGFTEMMTVTKAYRIVDIANCEKIGQGFNGTVYRIDQDNVVKVYNNPEALEDIQHEREVARLALVLGIPTAISYDVVRVGDSYGSVYELLNARSLAKIIAAEPDKLDWCVDEFVKLLWKIHGTLVPAGKLPDMKERAVEWARFMQDYLPEKAGGKLVSMIEAVPHDDHMIHGDYHTRNLELQNDEVLLIDMDTLSVGHPIFELASIYNSFIGFSEVDHSLIQKYQGYDLETGKTFWKKSLAAYLGTENRAKNEEVENKARIIGYTRLIRRAIRRGGENQEEIGHWTEELLGLLDKVDRLVFSPNELEVEAVIENLPDVQSYVEERLESLGCPLKAQMQIAIAVEEIFVNIAHYAYAPEKGRATVRVEISEDPVVVTITFMDHGVPYDPLAKEDPDVTLPAEEREIGGLGILMTKKAMDDVAYEYRNGQNILTLKKNL